MEYASSWDMLRHGICFVMGYASSWDMLREKSSKCDVCGGLEFSQTSHLKTHHRIRANEKLCKCDVCTKEFSHVSILKNIAETCETYKERPFKCDVCDKKVNQYSNLLRHKNTNAGSFGERLHRMMNI
ncbi:hypothetical protein DINM_004574 [Dirofilaria immitis]|nr:hypothetical protein [Dirofilaria immitis]